MSVRNGNCAAILTILFISHHQSNIIRSSIIPALFFRRNGKFVQKKQRERFLIKVKIKNMFVFLF